MTTRDLATFLQRVARSCTILAGCLAQSLARKRLILQGYIAMQDILRGHFHPARYLARTFSSCKRSCTYPRKDILHHCKVSGILSCKLKHKIGIYLSPRLALNCLHLAAFTRIAKLYYSKSTCLQRQNKTEKKRTRSLQFKAS